MAVDEQQIPERWQDWAEKILAERDDLRRKLTEMTAAKDAERLELEARVTELDTAAQTMVSNIRTIVNDPKMTREQVQSRLLLVVQSAERIGL